MKDYKILYKIQIFLFAASISFSCSSNNPKNENKTDKFSVRRIKHDAKISIISNEKDTAKYYLFSFVVNGYHEDSVNRICEISKYLHSRISHDTNVLYFEFYDNVDFLNKERYSPPTKDSAPVLTLEFKGDSIWRINSKLTQYAIDHI